MSEQENSESLLQQVAILEAQAEAARRAGNTSGANLSEGAARALRKLAGDGCDECGRAMDCPPDGASGIRLCTRCGGKSLPEAQVGPSGGTPTATVWMCDYCGAKYPQKNPPAKCDCCRGHYAPGRLGLANYTYNFVLAPSPGTADAAQVGKPGACDICGGLNGEHDHARHDSFWWGSSSDREGSIVPSLPAPEAAATPKPELKPDDEHIRWLKDCGWSGWLRDLFSGQITTSHGDTFASAKELREWLESLPKWPRAKNVPRRAAAGEDRTAGVKQKESEDGK